MVSRPDALSARHPGLSVKRRPVINFDFKGQIAHGVKFTLRSNFPQAAFAHQHASTPGNSDCEPQRGTIPTESRQLSFGRPVR